VRGCCNCLERHHFDITQQTEYNHSLLLPFFSLSILAVLFPVEPGLAGFIEAKDDGSGDDNWSYETCKAPVKSSPPTNQHPTFYRPDALPVSQTNSVRAPKGN